MMVNKQETKLTVMFHMSSRTSIVSLVLIRHKHCRHRALKFLIGQSFENVFSRPNPLTTPSQGQIN
jgi:hypothetical protein